MTKKGYLFISKSLSLNRLKDLYDRSIKEEDYEISELVNYFIKNELYDKVDDGYKPIDIENIMSLVNSIDVESLIGPLNDELDECDKLNKKPDEDLNKLLDETMDFVNHYNKKLRNTIQKIDKTIDNSYKKARNSIIENESRADLIDDKRIRSLYMKHYKYTKDKLDI